MWREYPEGLDGRVAGVSQGAARFDLSTRFHTTPSFECENTLKNMPKWLQSSIFSFYNTSRFQ
jgi:hypothetical protein